jgi:predicted PurR-regulated permease PerM
MDDSSDKTATPGTLPHALTHAVPPRPPAIPVSARLARFATIGIFLLLLGIVLDQARTLLLPIVSAALIAVMLGPFAARTRQWRIPPWLFAVVIVLALLAGANAVVFEASAALVGWIEKAPEITASIKTKLRSAIEPFESLRNLQSQLPQNVEHAGLDVAGIAQAALAFLTPTVGELAIFFAALFFALTGYHDLRRYFILAIDERESRLRRLRILSNIEKDLTSYAATVTIINLGLGTITGLIAYGIGLPYAWLWGVGTFALEFVPYLGPLTVLVALFGVGLVVLETISQALVGPLLFMVMDTISGYLIAPAVLGRRLTLNPGLVFLSIVFWAWLWGPIGAFIATPLLIAATVTLEHIFPGHEIELPG